jgi:hypothetical protein
MTVERLGVLPAALDSGSGAEFTIGPAFGLTRWRRRGMTGGALFDKRNREEAAQGPQISMTHLTLPFPGSRV